MVRHQRRPPRTTEAGVHPPPPCSHSLQKMLQCPYFFFDIVCIHNGTEEKEDERRWKVRETSQWSLTWTCPGSHLTAASYILL